MGSEMCIRDRLLGCADERSSSLASAASPVLSPAGAVDPRGQALVSERADHDQVALRAIDLAGATVQALGKITDKRSALATLGSLQVTVREAKALREQWKALERLSPEASRDLRKRHGDELKALGLSAGKTLLVLGARWKTREIRAGAMTLIKISRAVNGIRKELALFQ